MTATLFAIAITAALLQALRRRRNADEEAIALIRKWREGK
jgi:hypothetical protein